MHDRRRRQSPTACADLGSILGQPCSLDTSPGSAASPATVCCWNTARGVIDSPARRARLTSWIDTMLSPPSSKKLSSMPTRGNPQHLRKQRAQDLLLRRARRPPQRLRRAAPAPAARAGRACRSASAATDPAPPAPTAPCSPAAPAAHMRRNTTAAKSPPSAAQPPPHSRPAAVRPAHPPAPPPPPATPRLPQQYSLDLARLDPEPAQLHLRIGPPQKLQHPVRTPPRQVPGPVHPAAPARPIRVGHKPLRRQTRTPQYPRARPTPAM